MIDITKIQSDFGDHLFNFIKSKVASQQDAEDIYQDILYKILNKSDQLKNTQSLKSWLFTIARNQIIDYYRAKKNLADIDDLPLSAISEGDKLQVYDELEGCLTGFINQLEEDDKQLITLSEINGYSQKELAETLNINYVTLRSKIQRGRTKIRKMIMDGCQIDQDSLGGLIDCSPKHGSSVCGSSTSCGSD